MADEAIKAGAKAGLSIIESSLLGALCILCVAIAAACIWLLYKTQNARVADHKALADKLEAVITRQAELNGKTASAVEKLCEAEKSQAQLLQHIHMMLLGRGGGR